MCYIYICAKKDKCFVVQKNELNKEQTKKNATLLMKLVSNARI